MTAAEMCRLQEIEGHLARGERARALALRGNGVGIWEWEIDGTLWWDEAMFALFDVEPESFVPDYDSFISLVHPDDRECVNHRVSEALSGHTHFFTYYRIVTPVGAVKTIIASGAVEFSPDCRRATDAVRPLRMAGICVLQEGLSPFDCPSVSRCKLTCPK